MKYRITLPMSILLAGILVFSGTSSAMPFFSNWGRHDKTPAVAASSKRPELRRQRIRGTVVRVSGQVAYVRTSPFRTVMVRLGPESYWEAHGYTLVPGERVVVSGWYDPYVHSDVFFAGSIAGPGMSIILTNDIGEPLWVTEDYQYVSGWYPTYNVYEVWYRPTYRYVEVENAPPPRVRVESVPRYQPVPMVTPGGPRGSSAPPAKSSQPPARRKANYKGGPRGK